MHCGKPAMHDADLKGSEEDIVKRCMDSLRKNPEDLRAQTALGQHLISKGRYEEARPHLETVAELDPQNIENLKFLGNIYIVLGKTAQAERCFSSGLKLRCNDIHLLLGLANVHRVKGNVAESLDLFRRALDLDPRSELALSNLAAACLEFAETDEMIECFPDSTKNDPSVLCHVLSVLNYQSILDTNTIAAAHLEWGRRRMMNIPKRVHTLTPENIGDRAIRLGFVSGDFRLHPVGRFAAILFSHFDRKRFQLVAYDNSKGSDNLKKLLRTQVDRWHCIADVTDEEAAKRIREDKIDILIDLSGHTLENRLGVFAHRPTPIQVSLFGYPNTTGLEPIQYRITDYHADPPGKTEWFYSERLEHLPRIAWVYPAPERGPAPFPTPSKECGIFTFGCLNNPIKISQAAVNLWGSVLRQLPHARLKLLQQNTRYVERLKERFARTGASAAQLDFVPIADFSSYLEYHSDIDVMFDPLPYNGAITTCDALWLGVPVLTLAGDSYRSRQGVSILTNVGLTDCVAHNSESFVAKATELAEQPKLIENLRKNLREKIIASPLMDHAGYVNELSELLEKVWSSGFDRTIPGVISS